MSITFEHFKILTVICIAIQVLAAIHKFYFPKSESQDLRFKVAMSRLYCAIVLVLLISPDPHLSLLSAWLMIPTVIYQTHMDNEADRVRAKHSMSRQDRSIFNGHKIIRVTANSHFSNVYKLIQDQCHREHVKMPRLYMKLDNYLNGATNLRRKPYKIILTTGVLSQLKPKQIAALTGHEVGHLSQASERQQFWMRHPILSLEFCVFVSVGMTLSFSFLPRPIFNIAGMLFFAGLYVGTLMLPLLIYSRRNEYRADDHGARLTSVQDTIDLLKREEVLYPSLKHIDTIVHPSNEKRIINVKHYAQKHHLED